MQTGGSVAAASVPREPTVAAAQHRLANEIVLGERQHHLELAAAGEDGFGN